MPKPQKIIRDGTTSYRVQIRRPTKGVQVDRYFSTKRAADDYIRKVARAIDEGEPITENVRSQESFAGAVEIYLSDPLAFLTPKGKPFKASAVQDRTIRLRWLAQHFGQISLKNLSWELIDNRLRKLSVDRKWSSATRYRYETALSRLLEYGRHKGWVALNVLTDQQRLNDSGERHRTYTDDEWSAMLNAADAQRGMLAILLRLAWETGCRKSELINLRWVDVELLPEDHQLGAVLDIRHTKNNEDRRVFISKRTAILLKAHEQEFRTEHSALVFPSRTREGRYNPDALFREARAAAGLDMPDDKHNEVLSIHHIRHTWATRLGARGASLAQLMAAGGWKTSRMVERYMKRKEAQSQEAAVLLISQ